MSSFTDNEVSVLVTDLHPRITGVGSTIRTLAPHVHELEPMAMVSSRTLPSVPSIGVFQAIKHCLRTPQNKPFRIWHARRNKEMLLGLVLKYLLRSRLRLVMTSCALRRHSWFPRQLLASMDAIIATSDEAAGYVENVVATIPHGVDCDRFRPATDRREALRRLGVPGEYGISLVGRIRHEKGTDLFVDAMIELLPSFPDFSACIAGKATAEHERFYRQQRQKIEEAGLTDRFVWMGEISYERMPEFHSAMSLCVAPARYEGFGLVPLEAMACGVPVVATETGCYRDLINPHGCGQVVPCGQLEPLVESIRSLLESPERLVAMSSVCREIILSAYSAKIEAARIVDVYQQLWSKAA